MVTLVISTAVAVRAAHRAVLFPDALDRLRDLVGLARVEVAVDAAALLAEAVVHNDRPSSLRAVVEIGSQVSRSKVVGGTFPLAVEPEDVGLVAVDELLGLRHEVVADEVRHRDLARDAPLVQGCERREGVAAHAPMSAHRGPSRRSRRGAQSSHWRAPRGTRTPRPRREPVLEPAPATRVHQRPGDVEAGHEIDDIPMREARVPQTEAVVVLAKGNEVSRAALADQLRDALRVEGLGREERYEVVPLEGRPPGASVVLLQAGVHRMEIPVWIARLLPGLLVVAGHRIEPPVEEDPELCVHVPIRCGVARERVPAGCVGTLGDDAVQLLPRGAGALDLRLALHSPQLDGGVTLRRVGRWRHAGQEDRHGHER